MSTADVRFARFEHFVGKAETKSIDRDKVQSLLDDLKEPWDQIVADFVRLEEYRKFDDFKEESCQVEELVENSLLLLRIRSENQKILIKRNYTTTPPVLGDKLQIQHMLLNFLINSLDAMGRRGTLSVGTEVIDRYVRIRITDSGTGIPLELRSEVFKPFYTTKKHGTGLGLPISRYIARKHGGRIEFSSKTGKESTFYIYLPVKRKKEQI
jgi:signal transduction histidine kinase